MDVLALTSIWMTLIVAAVGAFSILGEFRRRRIGADVSQDRVFRCVRCTSVYTDDGEVERSRCPQCGKTNEAFRF
jgi:rubrerythrin